MFWKGLLSQSTVSIKFDKGSIFKQLNFNRHTKYFDCWNFTESVKVSDIPYENPDIIWF